MIETLRRASPLLLMGLLFSLSIPVVAIATQALSPPVTATGNFATPILTATNTGTGLAIQAQSVGGMALNVVTHSHRTFAIAAANVASGPGGAISAASHGNTIVAISQHQNALAGITKFAASTQENNGAGVIGFDGTSSLYNQGVAGESVGGTGVLALSTTTKTVGTALSARAVGGSGIVSTVSGDPVSGNCGLAAVFALSQFASVSLADSSPNICIGVAQARYSSGVTADGNPGVLGTGNQVPYKGPAAIAVEGIGDTGGRFVADGSNPDPFNLGNALEVEQDGSGLIISAHGTGGGLSLDDQGNLVISGTLTQHGVPLTYAVPGKAPTNRPIFSADQNAPTIENVGEGHLASGQSYVRLDAAFARSMNFAQRYQVFITPEGPSAGLYVTDKSSKGFAVRENPGGHSSVDFSYRIIGKAQERPSSANGRTFKGFDRHNEHRIIARLKATAKQYRNRPLSKPSI
ncbi:MAG: hypothetical protein M3Z14_04810 [Candidatus Eremiobacteraeota bacterium]|nr:hypothetical protein [Candidatus Eremiobacteraeota bacterium]